MVSVPPGCRTEPQASRRNGTVSKCAAGNSPPADSFSAALVASKSVWCGGSGWFTKSWAQEPGARRLCSASCASPTMSPALLPGAARPRSARRWKHRAARSKRTSQATQQAEGSLRACAQSHSPPPLQTSMFTGRGLDFLGVSNRQLKSKRLPPCALGSAPAASALALALALALRCFQSWALAAPDFPCDKATLKTPFTASVTAPFAGRPKAWLRRRQSAPAMPSWAAAACKAWRFRFLAICEGPFTGASVSPVPSSSKANVRRQRELRSTSLPSSMNASTSFSSARTSERRCARKTSKLLTLAEPSCPSSWSFHVARLPPLPAVSDL
mmetsp:Transcript_60016/g.160836  ORF Transcript_60016/g.160836 Transcript_60016/m.160836 type:complete len:328 (-) Transcript_60016:1070-2053(-)